MPKTHSVPYDTSQNYTIPLYTKRFNTEQYRTSFLLGLMELLIFNFQTTF